MGERSFLPVWVCEDREHETRNYQLTFGSIFRVEGHNFWSGVRFFWFRVIIFGLRVTIFVAQGHDFSGSGSQFLVWGHNFWSGGQIFLAQGHDFLVRPPFLENCLPYLLWCEKF